MTKRTPKELQKAAEHIQYKKNMFDFSINKLKELKFKKINDSSNTLNIDTSSEFYLSSEISNFENIFIQNLLIENCLLHTRVLYEFLITPKQKYPDDIHWTNFLPKETKQREYKKKLMEKKLINDKWPPTFFDKTRADKRLAHLTYSRKEFNKNNDQKNKENWKIIKIQKELDAIYKIFLEIIEEKKQKWFKNKKITCF